MKKWIRPLLKIVAASLLLVWTIVPSLVSETIVMETLDEKAKHFEKIVRDRHVKHGFIRELTLHVPGDPSQGGFLHSDDNDGLWTSLYVAAMSFKYAATRDEEARQWAKESMRSLEWLERITGIAGFPARSIVKAGDPKKYNYDGEWHLDASGEWEWKGDTSSDEIVGHFFAYTLYYDLVADETEKERVKALVKRLMDHILDHDWTLVDLDGKPTRWGVWNPEQLNRNKPIHGLEDENWREERGINSLEILSHLKAAYHITDDEMYQEKYLELVQKHGYAKNVIDQNVIDPSDVNHSDVELAFCAYDSLLKYESDSALAEIYRKSLKKTWEIVKREKNPWWNFTSHVFLKENGTREESLQTLREIPWKQTHVRMRRWNGDPYQDMTGGDGSIEGDGVLFLLPYWMGRYHGWIEDTLRWTEADEKRRGLNEKGD